MPQNSLPAPSLHEQSLSRGLRVVQRPQKAAKNSTPPTSTDQQAPVSSLNKKPANQIESIRLHLPSEMVAKLPLVSI